MRLMTIWVQKGQHFTIKRIVSLGRSSFDWNREYQRSVAWKPEKREKLVESCLMNLSIGTLVLKKHGKTFEVLDGQQRLETIFRFVEGNVNTPSTYEDFPAKQYSDLQEDPDRLADFEAFRIYYDQIHGGKDEEIADVFLRMQEGEPLRPPEKLNARLGEMRSFVVELSKHPLFKKGVKIDELRFAHRYIAAQIVLLENTSDLTSETVAFGNPRYPELSEMYDKFKNKLPSRIRHRVLGTFNLLYEAMGEDARVIRKKSDVSAVYVFASYLRNKYILDKNLLKEFVIDFFTKVALVRLRDDTVPKDDYELYASLRRKGLSPDTFKSRFNILLKLFAFYAPTMQLKDPKRLFDVGQKLAIYYCKNKGLCQYEGCPDRKVKWEDASFHHVKFHKSGGPTVVENGQLMHMNCHKNFHAKYGIDED
jgi:hypothetical protein